MAKTDVQLGDTARDSITGLEGVVVGDTMWLNGCRRLTLQPTGAKDGKPFETQGFDEEQLVLVKSAVHASKGRERMAPQPPRNVPATGGPHDEPTRAANPAR